MPICQGEAHFVGNLAQHSGRRLAIVDIGLSQHRGNGKPDRHHDGDDVRFPAIHLVVPARFGPTGFGINRSVGQLTLLPMLLMLHMLHTSSGAQDGTIDGHGSASAGPRLDQFYQMAAQAADLSRQDLWDRFQGSFPATGVGKLPCSCNSTRSVAVSAVGYASTLSSSLILYR